MSSTLELKYVKNQCYIDMYKKLSIENKRLVFSFACQLNNLFHEFKGIYRNIDYFKELAEGINSLDFSNRLDTKKLTETFIDYYIFINMKKDYSIKAKKELFCECFESLIINMLSKFEKENNV